MNSQKNPAKWDICGHENIANFLQLAISRDKIAHAYLFLGPDSIGKKLMAENFIQSLLCRQQEIGYCGQCHDCRQFKNNIHPDVFVVEREFDEKKDKLKKDISIDQLRDLKARLQQGSFFGGYKIGLVPDAQYTNVSGTNSLLKLFEEPAPKTVIILLAENIQQLPKTIISRCQIFKFLPVDQQKIENYLSAKDMAEPKKIARLSMGLPGVAITLAADRDLKTKKTNQIQAFFEILSSNMAIKFDSIGDLFNWQKDESSNIEETVQLLENWQLLMRDILMVKTNNYQLVCFQEYLEKIQQWQDYFAIEKISALNELIMQAKNKLRQNISSKNILENLIINI